MFYFTILMIKNGTIITFFEKKCKNICVYQKKAVPLHPLLRNKANLRAFSSAGLEHLPYKQRVCGSNP